MGWHQVTRRPTIAIDASNIHSGGALQVATSVIDEIGKLSRTGDHPWHWLNSVHIYASTHITAALPQAIKGNRVTVINRRPMNQISHFHHPGRHADVTLTLFGPTYYPCATGVQIVGFADGTSLFPERTPDKRKPTTAKARIRAAYAQHYFSNVDHIVVESPHAASGLQARWNIPRERITVIPNVLNQSLSKPTARRHSINGNILRLAYPARLHPHKNFAILGQAASILSRQESPIRVEYALTLTDSEWDRVDPVTRAYSVNFGPQATPSIGRVYEQSDGVVFPSLNEMFSATPLEAHHYQLPLLASDRDFVRHNSGPAALYFDPHSPQDLAQAIQTLFQASERDIAALTTKGKAIIDRWPTAKDRAVMYLTTIHDLIPNTGEQR